MATDPASRVRRENIEAARVAPTDPRWLLAVQVAMALEGGRAAVLPPEKRTGLLRLATRMGVGGFDANLVIAIIQDAARRGDPTLAPDTMARVGMVRSPDSTRSSDGRPLPSVGSMWRMLAIGAALGAIVATGLIRWISG